ncbi:hypothetical protein AMATHDRAFT_84731 [Amanita thiersii Skay4041]|uniref:BTB domain-containing protein n=1 Tax=Amanita thiersii Skay4041 TaxID=703135 RepID=A0A2A9NNV2_9AGAR|nr:hypothetical protein AMATHDRAFT_84731 [Amanita thiersii Skay4041]
MAYPNADKHERFYFLDGTLLLVVEDTLYRLHQYLFIQHSSSFPGISKSPVPAQSPFGWYDAPTLLKDVKRADFDRLLAYLYPDDLTVEGARSTEDWSSILSLATKWGFESLRKRAINKLKNIASPVDKVIIGRENNVQELQRPAYIALCESTVPLSIEEGNQLGLEDVIKIYHVRQEIWEAESPLDTRAVTDKVQRYWFQQDIPSKPPPDQSDHDSKELVKPLDFPPTPPSPRSRRDSDKYDKPPSSKSREARPVKQDVADVLRASKRDSLQASSHQEMSLKSGDLEKHDPGWGLVSGGEFAKPTDRLFGSVPVKPTTGGGTTTTATTSSPSLGSSASKKGIVMQMKSPWPSASSKGWGAELPSET